MEVRPMSTFPPPGSAALHYRTAERLLDSIDETPETAPMLAAVHALLAAAPRRARRTRRSAKFRETSSPTERWLRGEDGEQ
jgi:hypothetical protein